MDKKLIETFRSFQTRRAMQTTRRAVHKMHVVQRAPQAKPLTLNERDRFMHRRIERENAIRDAAAALLAKKKKLPLPVFACENTADQVRPRVVGGVE